MTSGDYHRLALKAADAWERLLEAPGDVLAEAEVAALEDRLTALEASFIADACGTGTTSVDCRVWLLDEIAAERNEAS